MSPGGNVLAYHTLEWSPQFESQTLEKENDNF